MFQFQARGGAGHPYQWTGPLGEGRSRTGKHAGFNRLGPDTAGNRRQVGLSTIVRVPRLIARRTSIERATLLSHALHNSDGALSQRSTQALSFFRERSALSPRHHPKTLLAGEQIVSRVGVRSVICWPLSRKPQSSVILQGSGGLNFSSYPLVSGQSNSLRLYARVRPVP